MELFCVRQKNDRLRQTDEISTHNVSQKNNTQSSRKGCINKMYKLAKKKIWDLLFFKMLLTTKDSNLCSK